MTRDELKELADKLGFAFEQGPHRGAPYALVNLVTGARPLGEGFCATLKQIERHLKDRDGPQPRDAQGRFESPAPSFPDSLSAAERAVRRGWETQDRQARALKEENDAIQDIKKSWRYQKFVSSPDKKQQQFLEKLADRAVDTFRDHDSPEPRFGLYGRDPGPTTKELREDLLARKAAARDFDAPDPAASGYATPKASSARPAVVDATQKLSKDELQRRERQRQAEHKAELERKALRSELKAMILGARARKDWPIVIAGLDRAKRELGHGNLTAFVEKDLGLTMREVQRLKNDK
jgi:hypothetical protein